ncbi:Ecotropic viral integration site 5 protein-like protein [Diplodia seriata]|uniref:Ecotropic viral integration site 5 protein-like protein n=1 Tax=Diplodia seriata TaxID=420778 RepID=A0A1S8BJM6_9PEZI|nr:Ecotropic viral integration site 5 protein-like protein [Diplodia seriata]
MALDEATSPTADSPVTDFQNSRKHDGGKPLPTDSMVTVPLSPTDGESPPVPSLDAALASKPEITVNKTRDSKAPSLNEVMEKVSEDEKKSANDTPEDGAVKTPGSRPSTIGRRSRRSSSGSADSEKVDWEQLDKKEEQIEQDSRSDESTALLLARLEQENQAIATDPKSAASKARSRSQSRPPSMNQLKKLVEDQNNSESVRFSLLPSPPPMTELEFWAALVRDYTGTAQRLPTLTSNKIRAGIPAPLRGVTWVSMAGARDRGIEEQYERLCNETSPYENMIGKDIGRSFPGVEMFRDPEGEGQKMLGRVLKCFSLYDDKIGYCQGLGFLVGPLLMQMGDKEAFCVLVRLMEDYDLRSCFLPDLSGLHLRIYQFRRLMMQHIPELYAHLETMNIEAAYLSQWFLSFFAVTCPLPMLFRIYDVIFAEGASETIMRVALAIMRKNESRLLAFTEFEDVIQLLLSRSLWDPYGCNQQSADDLVNDFCSFTSVVTREHLQALESSFRAESSDETVSRGFFPEVQNAAQRFLGRIWGPDKRNTTATLSPPADKPSRPVSFMKRTASKQSIASTLNSVEAASDSTGRSHNSTATAMTELTNRESTADAMSVKSMKTGNVRNTMMSHHDRDLHSQIEDLLTALSEMQREHANLAAQLQKEREDRREDHRVVRGLVERVKQDKGITTTTKAQRRRTSPLNSIDDLKNKRMSTPPSLTSNEDFQGLVEKIETRFPAKAQHSRNSSVFETKQYLRESLARSKEQLHLETTRSQSLSRQLLDAETETSSLRNQLDETRQRLQASMIEKQRFERHIQELKLENQKARKASTWSGSESDVPSLTRSDTADSISSSNSNKGLREFKLGRSNTMRTPQKTRNSFGRIAPTPCNTSASAPVPSQRSSTPHTTSASPMFAKRSSSLSAHAALTSSPQPDPASDDALLLELVNAKTAEAVARQELEELRARFESMRKMLGVATPSASSGTSSGLTPQKSATSDGGFFTSSSKPPGSSHSTASTNGGGGGGGGGFWGWGKRSVSTTAAEAK